MTPADGGTTPGELGWEQRDGRSSTLAIPGGAAEWVEVTRTAGAVAPVWRVEGRLGGRHYKLADPFTSKETAQGSAVLLAMRLLPARRDALHAVLDRVPGVWWWKISPLDDASAEHRAILSSRVCDTAGAAERAGRAAGAGWWLYVFGPGSAQAFGRLPR